MPSFFASICCRLRTLVCADDGLMKLERALLTGAAVMTALTVLLLLGVDILGWFGVEPPEG